MASNLEDALRLEERSEETSIKDWDKMDRAMCGAIRSYLIQDIKYHVMTDILVRKIWKILESKYLTKSIENRLHLKKRLYRFELKRGIFIGEHMNNYTQFLTDLVNVDAVIEEENKVLIMLSSLLHEDYETFILTLINGK